MGIEVATETELSTLTARVAALESGTSDASLAERVSVIETTLGLIKTALMNTTAVTQAPGGTTTTPPAGGGTTPPPDGGTGTSGPFTGNAFPSDPSVAPYPSPEGSAQIVLGGSLSGVSYLKSPDAGIWKFVLDSSGKPLPNTPANNPGGNNNGGFVFEINGVYAVDGATELRIDGSGRPYYVIADGTACHSEGPGDRINNGSAPIKPAALTGSPYLPNFVPDPTNSTIFPANIGTAKPTPVGTAQYVLDGNIIGDPYLVSPNGAVWQFKADASGNPIRNTAANNPSGNNDGGWVFEVNGLMAVDGATMLRQDGSQVPYFTFIQGNVALRYEKGDSINTGTGQITPTKVTGGTAPSGGTTTSPSGGNVSATVGPTPVSPAPGSSGVVVLYGTNQTFKTPQAAHDASTTNNGDTIKAAPEMIGVTTADTFCPTKAVLIDFGGRITAGAGTENPTYVPGHMLDVSSLADPSGYPHQLAAIVPMTDCIVRGAKVVGTGMQEGNHGGTAGVRMGADGNLIVDNCDLSLNQNGIGPSSFNVTTTVTNTILLDNGLGVQDGGSHNVYVEGASATFGPGVTSIVNLGTSTRGGGHAIKSRAQVTNFIGPCYFYSSDAATIDIPDGSAIACNIGAGVVIVKKAGDQNHTLIDYAVESSNNGVVGVKVTGAQIVGGCDNPLMIAGDGTMTFDSACTFLSAAGQPLPNGTVQAQGGGTVTGLP